MTALMLLCGLTLIPVDSALAAPVTEIMDGLTEDPKNEVDVSLDVGWDMAVRQGRILREFECLANDQQLNPPFADGLCPEQSEIVLVRELVAQRISHRLNVDIAIAYKRWFQFSVLLPIVLHDLTELSADAGVTQSNSTVDPAGEGPGLFSLFPGPNRGTVRSGIADPTMMVRIVPISSARDPYHPTVALDLGLTTGLVQARRAGNSAVGEGTWSLLAATAISAKPVHWAEPWFRLGFRFRFEGSNTLFKQLSSTQTLTLPGHEFDASIGTTFIPFEDIDKRSAFTIDVGAGLMYRFEGREYTDLFEALGGAKCDGGQQDVSCALTAYERDTLSGENAQQLAQSDGVTDVEQYATLRGWITLKYQILEYFSAELGGRLAYELPHFLTFADVCDDVDGDGFCDSADGGGEFNPVYVEALDGYGNRFRSGGMMTYGIRFALRGKF
jgi:hypothetical protein